MTVAEPSLWDRLPAEIPPYGEFVAHRVHAEPAVFLAADHEGAPHLLLELAGERREFNDDRSRGLHVVAHPLRVEGRPEAPFIDVRSTDPAGRELFRLVTTEIVDAVERGIPPAESVEQTIARWRRFWGDVPEQGLSPEQVRGLFGELWFLLFWLLPSDHRHIEHWFGFEQGRHDFQWPHLAVECKATTSVRGHIHRINGIDQLAIPERGNLYLFSLRVREEGSASNSLVTLVERALATLKGNDALVDQLELGLARSGYSPAHANRYRTMTFHVVDERLYQVGDGFPRLTPTSFAGGVPTGIERIEYDINLGTAQGLCVAERPADAPRRIIEAAKRGLAAR